LKVERALTDGKSRAETCGLVVSERNMFLKNVLGTRFAGWL
jgi:hypothetical protein